ncbi:unnamed protein product [Strongylus vulgaris]|uniref:Uncharacterized protein n=1 Tax=Strongylus vulgaris TaxID=40348 RepID=A0A3P7J3P6_STRVU|nr:unnamed protein product [Strongylus vulgaris]
MCLSAAPMCSFALEFLLICCQYVTIAASEASRRPTTPDHKAAQHIDSLLTCILPICCDITCPTSHSPSPTVRLLKMSDENVCDTVESDEADLLDVINIQQSTGTAAIAEMVAMKLHDVPNRLVIAPDEPSGMDCFADDRDALNDFAKYYNNAHLSDVNIIVGDDT